MSKGHRQGGKMIGSHTTVIPAAERVVDFLSREDSVNKISVGFIKHGIKSGKHSIKIMEMESGLLLKIRGSASIQEIRIYTSQKDIVISVIKKFANKYKYMCK
ncbi:MAG: DUF2103 domain-containing protein [Candidatus Moraniibacteriota bacterium]|jgi:predicted metal-binding protein DUF2103